MVCAEILAVSWVLMLRESRARRMLASAEAMCCQDRRLACLFATFNRLAAGEPMPLTERLTARRAGRACSFWLSAVLAAAAAAAIVTAAVTPPVHVKSPATEMASGHSGHRPAGRFAAVLRALG
jgi:hypothetical protein